jgi:hypothetical protein
MYINQLQTEHKTSDNIDRKKRMSGTEFFTLMFVQGVDRRSRNAQHYALVFTATLFYILVHTCFGSSLPSSRSFLDPSELLEIQIQWVVYHIMCGYALAYPGGCLGVQTPPPPKFRSFEKAWPISQFRGIYICNNLSRIWVSFICKLSGTPDWGATAPRYPFSLPSILY